MSSINSSMVDMLGTYPYHTFAAFFFGVVLVRRLTKGRDRNPNGLPLPPGPKGYPLIGNLFDMPADKPWVVYDEWRKTYGDLIYLKVFGQSFVFLSSPKIITDLFEKRSSNYSDRKRMTMFNDLMNWDMSLAVQPYGPWWRRHRRLFHEHFHRIAVTKYQPIQRREVQSFLHRLLVTPDNFLHHIQHTFAATIMKIGYGISVQENNDPYISAAEEVLDGLTQAAVPGTFLVDVIPILKYVPSWFPGADFQKKAARWRKANQIMAEKPFYYVKEQLKIGKATPSVAASLIEHLPDDGDPQRPMEEMVAQDVLFAAYVGGADTTVSSVQALFLAMVLHPEEQKKAQVEIDAVVGPNRFPDFCDRPSLPYINAIVKELMRWHSVLPFGLAHMATNDDEYNGYYIPKGTLLIVNAWSIMHDPEVFNDPMVFQPERYLKDGELNPDVKDPDSAVFGYGRRICPGRHLSDNSLYLFVSRLLAVYDIKPAVDDHGNTVEMKPEFSNNGLLSFPAPFKCVITPRSPAAEALILETE